eukprot:3938544-Rhodomonas_salina.1
MAAFFTLSLKASERFLCAATVVSFSKHAREGSCKGAHRRLAPVVSPGHGRWLGGGSGNLVGLFL